jgi:hypothetical protein
MRRSFFEYPVIYFRSEISQAIALNLGLTEEQYNIWTEMEMVAFSVLLSCRKWDLTISSFFILSLM